MGSPGKYSPTSLGNINIVSQKNLREYQSLAKVENIFHCCAGHRRCACMHAAGSFAACKPGASDETGSPGKYSPTSLASSADRRPIYQSGRHSGHIRSSAHLFCSLPEIRGAATFVVTDQSIFSISGLSYVFLIGTLCPIGSQGYPPCHIPIDRNHRR